MLWTLTLLLAFLPAGRQTSSYLEERIMSITRPVGSSVIITCDIHGNDNYIHWYRFQKGQDPQHLLYYNSISSTTVVDSRLDPEKYHVYEGTDRRYKFVLRNVEESDSALYYCATWGYSSGWSKVFAEGTKLIVIPADKSFNADISPKPTIFLPSSAEINLHKTGTYLCLLEKFFPDVIRVYWKEKDSNTILDSQEGETLKTNDTYMKFSWLTVPEGSMGKEHRCIVKHENNKGGADQEIFFPSIKKVAVSTQPTTCWQDKNDVLQLQFTGTSAYYTYLLLLLKSVLYLAIISFFLLRRTASCGNKKRS